MGKHNSINPARNEKTVPTPRIQFSEGLTDAQRIRVIINKQMLIVRARSLM